MSDGALRRFGFLFLDGALFLAGFLARFGLLFSIRLLSHFSALSMYGFLLLGGSLSAEWVSCDQRFTHRFRDSQAFRSSPKHRVPYSVWNTSHWWVSLILWGAFNAWVSFL